MSRRKAERKDKKNSRLFGYLPKTPDPNGTSQRSSTR